MYSAPRLEDEDELLHGLGDDDRCLCENVTGFWSSLRTEHFILALSDFKTRCILSVNFVFSIAVSLKCFFLKCFLKTTLFKRVCRNEIYDTYVVCIYFNLVLFDQLLRLFRNQIFCILLKWKEVIYKEHIL